MAIIPASVLEGIALQMLLVNQQNRTVTHRLKYCIQAKFTELITVLWLWKRILLSLRKFTVKYLGVKDHVVRCT